MKMMSTADLDNIQLPDMAACLTGQLGAPAKPLLGQQQQSLHLVRGYAYVGIPQGIEIQANLSEDPRRILPGGFYVLRHAPVPAVLGEPAMISNPVIEGRLSLARSLELEASAYFLGLREYFAAGTPRWLSDLPDTVTAAEIPELVMDQIELEVFALTDVFGPGETAALLRAAQK